MGAFRIARDAARGVYESGISLISSRLRKEEDDDAKVQQAVDEENKARHAVRMQRRAALQEQLRSTVADLNAKAQHLQKAISTATSIVQGWDKLASEAKTQFKSDVIKTTVEQIEALRKDVIASVGLANHAAALLRTTGQDAKADYSDVYDPAKPKDAMRRLIVLSHRIRLHNTTKTGDAAAIQTAMNDAIKAVGDAVKPTPEYAAAAKAINQPPPTPAPTVAASSAAKPSGAQPVAPAAASAAAAAAAAGPKNPILERARANKTAQEAALKDSTEMEALAAKTPELASALKSARRACAGAVAKTSATLKSVIGNFQTVLSTIANVPPGAPPEKYRAYLYTNIARELVDQGDLRLIAHGHIGFLLAAKLPGFLPVLLGTFNAENVLTIPYIPVRKPGMDEVAFRTAMRFQVTDGVLENTDTFLNRVQSSLKLYLSFLSISMQAYPANLVHPYGISEAWTWLAAMVNSEPGFYTATALSAFLEVAGAPLYRAYPQQVAKVLRLVAVAVMPKLRAIKADFLGEAGKTHINRLEDQLRIFLQTGQIEEIKDWRISADAGVQQVFSDRDIEQSKFIQGN